MLGSSAGFKANSLQKDLKYTKSQMIDLLYRGISNMSNKSLDPNSFKFLSMKEKTYSYYNLSENTSEIRSVAYSPCGKFLAVGT